MVGTDRWIIDGNYKGTFDIRFPAADTIIFLDYPRWLTLGRAFKRRLQYHHKLRPDMPKEWKERISWEFLTFICGYKNKERPKVLSLLQENKEGKSIHIVKSPKEAEGLLEFISSLS